MVSLPKWHAKKVEETPDLTEDISSAVSDVASFAVRPSPYLPAPPHISTCRT